VIGTIPTRFHDKTLKDFVYILIKCVNRQVKGCLKYSLNCRDVPAATSPLLRSLGLSDYKVKKFWKIAKLLTGFSINIYRYEKAYFYIVLEVRKEPIFMFRNVYTDFIDCQEVHCIEAPKGNKLYIYIEGSVEGSFIKINAIFLLKELLKHKPKCYDSIMNLILGSLRGNTHAILDNIACLFKVISAYRHMVSIVLPETPVSMKDLLRVSPIIRALISKMKLLPSS